MYQHFELRFVAFATLVDKVITTDSLKSHNPVQSTNLIDATLHFDVQKQKVYI